MVAIMTITTRVAISDHFGSRKNRTVPRGSISSPSGPEAEVALPPVRWDCEVGCGVCHEVNIQHLALAGLEVECNWLLAEPDGNACAASVSLHDSDGVEDFAEAGDPDLAVDLHCCRARGTDGERSHSRPLPCGAFLDAWRVAAGPVEETHDRRQVDFRVAVLEPELIVPNLLHIDTQHEDSEAHRSDERQGEQEDDQGAHGASRGERTVLTATMKLCFCQCLGSEMRVIMVCHSEACPSGRRA